jgi:hypothetical protein
VDPLAQRILDEIQRGHLDDADRAALAAVLRKRKHGHPSPTATWADGHEFLVDLCEWVATLPAEDLPPRMETAARRFGRSSRTISRWLERAHVAGWDGFLRFWTLSQRD